MSDYCPPPIPEDVKVNNQDPLRGESGEGKVGETHLTNKCTPKGHTRSQSGQWLVGWIGVKDPRSREFRAR